jgi:hypothetical protein
VSRYRDTLICLSIVVVEPNGEHRGGAIRHKVAKASQ